MLIKDVPAADYNQLFDGTVMFYKKQKRWVRIRGFAGTKVLIKFLDSREEVFTIFNDENFSTEHPKLGMVNVARGVVFISRIPKRIMKAAFCANTMQIEFPLKDRVAWSGSGVRDVMFDFPTPIVETFIGNYPSFKDAVLRIRERQDFACAFDRQFCLNFRGDIYFKGNPLPVGRIDVASHDSIDKIEWAVGMSPLQLIIGDNCAKTLQSFKQAPATRIARG